MSQRTLATAAPIAPGRHVRAIALLPLMNTVVIPSVLLLLSPAPPAPTSAASWGLLVAGLAVAALGAAFVVGSVSLFVRLGRGTLAPWDPTAELVTVGLYRHCRNPMKAGLFLVLAGEALSFRSTALTYWLLAFAVANVVYIRTWEEPGLLARFGDRYRDYCAAVPRWWPAAASWLKVWRQLWRRVSRVAVQS